MNGEIGAGSEQDGLHFNSRQFVRLVSLTSLICLGITLAASAAHAATTLAVAARPFESADRATRTDLRHAEIDGQFRPVLETAKPLWLTSYKTKTYDGEAFVLEFEAPLYLNQRATLVQREFEFQPGGENWRALPPQLKHIEGGIISVRIPAPEGHRVRARGTLVPTEPLDRTSSEIRIPEGASLQGSIGLSSLVPPEKSTSVRFRILAIEGESASPIYEFVLHPSTATRKWTDYTVDLSRFAGKSLRFRMVTENLRGWPGKDFSLPLIGSPVVTAPTRTDRPNFILVSLDTLRADAVSAYGAEERATPNLGRFASHGVTFLDASTTYPSTTASHMSLFTGLYPDAHKVFAPPTRLKPDIPTLPDLLAQAGYRTGAVTENGMLFANAGFVRGFDSYDEIVEEDSLATPGWAAEVIDRGIAWLEQYPQERFFLFLHTYQVHEPYIAPEGFDQFPIPEGTPFGKKLQAYKAEVLYTDHQMGRLLRVLERLGLAGNTVVIFTSDHGEAFGEDGLDSHGYSLHEEAMRIPLLMRIPGKMQPGIRVKDPVSLVDLLPTITSLAGIARPEILQGRSLVPASGGKEDASLKNRKLYMQRRLLDNRREQFAVRIGTEKWLIGPDVGEVRRFDLATDPREERGSTSDEVQQKGQDLLEEFQQASRDIISSYGENAASSDLDAATRDRLRALGYLDVADSPGQP